MAHAWRDELETDRIATALERIADALERLDDKAPMVTRALR